MANVMRNAVVKFDGTDVSSLIRDCSVERAYDSVDVTSMGAIAKAFTPGLREDKFTFTAYTGFGASSLYAILESKFSTSGTVAVQIWPNFNGSGSTTGTANPLISGGCSVMTYNPLAGAVGDAAMTPLELPLSSGTISIATA